MRVLRLAMVLRLRTFLPERRRWIHDMPDESAIVPRSGSASALSAAEFGPMLAGILASAYGYALRLTRNTADAEDLVQDAALRAFRGAGSFEAGTNFKAWFFKILTRCFWSKHRESQRRPVTVDIEDPQSISLFRQSRATGLLQQSDDPASLLIDRLGTERVVQAIAQLPEEYATVCTLYFMEDFSYQEIAEVLDVPVGTVRSRLHRGRKLLQKALWRLAEDSGIVSDLTSREDQR